MVIVRWWRDDYLSAEGGAGQIADQCGETVECDVKTVEIQMEVTQLAAQSAPQIFIVLEQIDPGARVLGFDVASERG